MNKQLIDNAIAHIKERFKDEFSGHDYFHSLRVFNLATQIAKKEANVNIEVVQLAALLHDVDDYKLFSGIAGSNANAREFLAMNNVYATDIELICDIISKVSYKGTDTEVHSTIEGKIVQDADRLDAIGAMGIARTFAYGGNRHRTMHDPDIKPRRNMDFAEYSKSTGTTINHFYEKLVKLKDMMNTNTAKELAEGRHNFMCEFLEEFTGEWDGII